MQNLKGRNVGRFLVCLLMSMATYSAPTAGYVGGLYRSPVFKGRQAPRKYAWLDVTPKNSYPALNITLIFFLLTICGWVWECTMRLVESGAFVNRGTLYGPWLPIYGIGGIAILLVLNRFRSHPFICFVSAAALCGVIEYVAATVLWHAIRLSYWDYSEYPLNIQGRVYLEGLIAFGVLGLICMYIIVPITDKLLERIPRSVRLSICILLLGLMITDIVICQYYPHVGPGITS